MIVFLDFDGPIYPDKVLELEENKGDFCYQKCKELNIHPFYNYWYADRNIINFLNDLKTEYDYKIVLSTSWSYDYMNTKDELIEILNQNGLFFDLHQNWRTPKEKKERIEQIEDWLKQNNEDEYIILDDIKSMPEIQSDVKSDINLGNVILADLHNGYNDNDFQRIRKIFENFNQNKNKKLNFKKSLI